jgi:heptaprenyl diphosphate synthase
VIGNFGICKTATLPVWDIYKMDGKRRILHISVLIAFASVLQIVESLFPHPLPWLRLGLANMVTLMSLVIFGYGVAIQVAVLRTILSSFLLGTFLTPGFLLSFSGALVSALVMGGIYSLDRMGKGNPSPRYLSGFSIIGVSILGALSHNLTQLFVAYFLLIKHRGVFLILPFLIVAAVITGFITGYGANYLITEVGKTIYPLGRDPETRDPSLRSG